jgi:hypothetical protein
MRLSNIALMNRIVAHVRDKGGDVSMGEIELEVHVPVWKQYWLARAYRDYFLDIRLEESRWEINAVKGNGIVPPQTQDILSHTHTKKEREE